MRLFWLIGIFLLSLISLPAGAGDPGVTNDLIVLGRHEVASGPNGQVGVVGRVMKAYFEDLNEQGGIFGRKIKLLAIDTQGNPQKDFAATRQLVEKDQIFAMVGNQGIPPASEYDYLETNGVPNLWITDSSSTALKPLRKHVFSLFMPQETDAATAASYVVKKFKGKKACFVEADTTEGAEYIDAAKRAIEDANKGLSASDKLIVGPVERLDHTAVQADTQAINLKKAACDVVFLGNKGPLSQILMNAGFGFGFKPIWVGSWMNGNEKAISLLKPGIRNNFVATTPRALDETFKVNGWDAYVKFFNKHGFIVSGLAGTGYIIAQLTHEVLLRAGKDLTRKKLLESAESFRDWSCGICVSGITTSPTRHFAISKPAVIEVQGGKWVQVP